MANSGKSRSPDLIEAVAGNLVPRLHPGDEVLLGLSGGVDSVVLLDCLARLSASGRFKLRALHVHHGISGNADGWADFCAALCCDLGVPLHVVRIDLGRRRDRGVEAAARSARYAALAAHARDLVVTAHHRDDQAETLLLQMMRGSGVSGLGAMRAERFVEAAGIRLVRPMLEVDRAGIMAHARFRRLVWIEDESNDDTQLARNFLRHRVLPLIEGRWPDARARLAGAARLQAEAASMLSGLAAIDAERAACGGGWSLGVLRALGETRAVNLFHHALSERGARTPGRSALGEFWRQACDAGLGASPELRAGSLRLRRYRDRVLIDEDAPMRHAVAEIRWHGETSLELRELGGVMRFVDEIGRGIARVRIEGARVTLRPRRGGERLRLAENRPSRSLKNLFQEGDVPPWSRAGLPLLYCDDILVAVPGVGEHWQWRAEPGESGVCLSWEPDGRRGSARSAEG